MASINATTSSGIVATADNTGQLQLQSAGTTIADVTSTGMAVTGTGSFSGNLSFNSGYGSAAVAYGCRAWVNFNGTGVVAIRASGNVTSITDNGTGYYTVNFTTAMSDANYALTGTAQHASLGYLTVGSNGGTYLATTSSVRFQTGQGATEYDAAFVQVAILR
jgi:hypothetical protein